jgi:hypothetical protein
VRRIHWRLHANSMDPNLSVGRPKKLPLSGVREPRIARTDYLAAGTLGADSNWTPRRNSPKSIASARYWPDLRRTMTPSTGKDSYRPKRTDANGTFRAMKSRLFMEKLAPLAART